MKIYALKIVIYCFSIIVSMCCFGCTSSPTNENDIAPTILVLGKNPLKIAIHQTFKDDSMLIRSLSGIDSVWIHHNIDTAKIGYYQIYYHVKAKNGLDADAKRDVWIIATPSNLMGKWNVALLQLPAITFPTTQDSLFIENDTLFINNFNQIEQSKVKIFLASNLQDSIIITKQYIADSSFEVFGHGTIAQNALEINLSYTIINIKNNDSIMYKAVYQKAQSISLNKPLY